MHLDFSDFSEKCASAIKFHVHCTLSQPLISFGSGSLARWTDKQTDKQTNILILLIEREIYREIKISDVQVVMTKKYILWFQR